VYLHFQRHHLAQRPVHECGLQQLPTRRLERSVHAQHRHRHAQRHVQERGRQHKLAGWYAGAENVPHSRRQKRAPSTSAGYSTPPNAELKNTSTHNTAAATYNGGPTSAGDKTGNQVGTGGGDTHSADAATYSSASTSAGHSVRP